jgi:hypothetical protein
VNNWPIASTWRSRESRDQIDDRRRRYDRSHRISTSSASRRACERDAASDVPRSGWVSRPFILALAREGTTLIQIDEPAVPGLYGDDPHKAKDIARLFNACVAGISGVKFALHICFGTQEGAVRETNVPVILP